MKRSHKEDLRCTICCAVLVLIAAIGPLHAQDVLPGSLSCHVGGTDCDTLCLYSQRTDRHRIRTLGIEAESITIRSTGMTRKAAWQYVLCMERPYRRNQHQHRAANRTS